MTTEDNMLEEIRKQIIYYSQNKTWNATRRDQLVRDYAILTGKKEVEQEDE